MTTEKQQNKSGVPAFIAAYRATDAEQKRNGYYLLGACGVTVAVLLVSRILWLLEPLYALAYYGTLSELLYFCVLPVVYIPYLVYMHYFIKRHTGERVMTPKKEQVGYLRTLGVIAVAAVTVFITGAAFKFRLKLQMELGSGVVVATALTNVGVYAYYAFHLLMGLVAAELFRKAMALLVPARRQAPWGSLFLVAVFGVLELILELFTTAHLYPWVYFLFCYAYAAIYELTGHGLYLTFVASFIILVL